MCTKLCRNSKDLVSQNTTTSIKGRDSSVQSSIPHSIITHPVQKASNTSKVLSLLFSVVVPEEEAVRNRSTCRMIFFFFGQKHDCGVMRPVLGLDKNQNYFRLQSRLNPTDLCTGLNLDTWIYQIHADTEFVFDEMMNVALACCSLLKSRSE